MGTQKSTQSSLLFIAFCIPVFLFLYSSGAFQILITFFSPYPTHKILAEPTDPQHLLQLTTKRNAIRNAFLHAWNGYVQYAFGKDELKPCTNKSIDCFGGFGVTIIDALDTMLLMNLTEPFEKSREFVKSISFRKDEWVGIFETTIRIIGGLLSAHTLTQDELFLKKAQEITDLLLPAFETKSGIPYSEVNLLTGEKRNPGWHKRDSILSEVGSIQLEFKYLSYHTKNDTYRQKADHVTDVLLKSYAKIESTYGVRGLYPNYINTQTGEYTKLHISYGALGDSFYEYLLKQWLLTGKKEHKFRELYDEAIQAMKDNLLCYSKPSELAYVAEMYAFSNKLAKFDHLVCFLPGLLVLGAEGKTFLEDTQLAREILHTCTTVYSRTKTGIGAEIVVFENMTRDFNIKASSYLLRPEYVESLFYMYRFTGDQKYRDLGWKVFEVMETKNINTTVGY